MTHVTMCNVVGVTCTQIKENYQQNKVGEYWTDIHHMKKKPTLTHVYVEW